MSSILIGFVVGFAVMYLIALLAILVVVRALSRPSKTSVYDKHCSNSGVCDSCDLQDECMQYGLENE